MRVVLLSTLEPAADDPATPRGLLRLGGRSIVQHQLETAMALGCEKAICLADGLPGELIALQHEAERGGAQFQIAADGLAVSQAVKPDDELLVFADGLVVAPETVSAVLGVKSGVVVQPVETGIAAGYERLDLNHAGGGVLRLPGRMAAGLADLPGDWNPVSSLLRMAMQASLRQAVLPAALVAEGGWNLIRSDAEAHRFEPLWLRQHTGDLERGGPSRWLAARLVERIGPALLHAGTRPVALDAAAAALGLIALLLAWFGQFAPGFGVLGLAWLARGCSSILARVHGGRTRKTWFAPETVFRLFGDAAGAAIAAWTYASASMDRGAVALGTFVALVLIGQVRLAESLFPDRPWATWIADRLVLNIGLGAAALSESFDLALPAAVLGVLGLSLTAAGRTAASPAREQTDAPAARDRLTRS